MSPFSAPVLQLTACTGALGILAAQPAAARPLLLVPFNGRPPVAALASGTRLLGAGPLPGSLVVAPGAPLAGSGYLVLAASGPVCGTNNR